MAARGMRKMISGLYGLSVPNETVSVSDQPNLPRGALHIGFLRARLMRIALAPTSCQSGSWSEGILGSAHPHRTIALSAFIRTTRTTKDTIISPIMPPGPTCQYALSPFLICVMLLLTSRHYRAG